MQLCVGALESVWNSQLPADKLFLGFRACFRGGCSILGGLRVGISSGCRGPFNQGVPFSFVFGNSVAITAGPLVAIFLLYCFLPSTQVLSLVIIG